MEWLKKIFKKPVEEESITIDQIPDWFRQETKGKLDRLEHEIEAQKKEIQERVKEIPQILSKLETAELSNKNIQERAKHFMTGNRENYSKQINHFVNNINYEGEPKEFVARFKEQLNALNKSSNRSYAILQEFFGNEVREMAYNIGKINKALQTIEQQVDDPDLKEINQTKEQITELFRQIEINKKRATEIEELKEEIDKAVKHKELIEAAQTALTKSSEYEEYFEIEQRIKEAKIKKAKVLDEITQIISPVTKALKKYQKMAFSGQADIINLYLTDLYKALNVDTKWDILLVLQNIERMIKDNQLGLKDDKLEKTMSNINKITKEILNDYKQKLNLATAEKTGVNTKNEKIYVVGDRLSDIETGLNAKGKSIFIPFKGEDQELAKVKKKYSKNKNVLFEKDLLSAAKKI